MFVFGYLILVAVAAIPLALTLVRHGARPPTAALVRRIYRALGYIAAAILAIIAFEMALSISLESDWFAELGQSYRFWLSLGLQLAIFAAVLVIGGLFLGFNLRQALRPATSAPLSAPWVAGFLVAAVIALGATGLWMRVAAFLGAAPSGVADPLFGRDLSFYLLALPLYRAILALATTFVVLAFLGWLVLGLVFSGSWRRINRRLTLVGDDSATAKRAIEARFFAARPIAGDVWLRHGLALGALFCLFSGLSTFLGRYQLAVAGHSRVVAGASWIDDHVWLPVYWVFIASWALAAVGLAAAAVAPGVRRWLVGNRWRGVRLAGLLAAFYVAAAITPAIVENLYVGPNQITLEQPYLVRSIAGTRQAFGLAGPNLDDQDFDVSPTPLTQADLVQNAATLRDARIWDWQALEPQLQQTQGLRPYYSFSGGDLDRYQIDGAERQVMITARELDVGKLPAPAQVWVNLALKYTHGFGVVAVPANEMDEHGGPVLWAHDIPIQAKGDLAVRHGEIYYGLQTQDRVYVRTTEKEFDFPRGDANAETTYSGAGGIPLSDLWRKIVVARAFDGLRLFISGYFTPASRILIRRNVVERVHRLAPFLILDHDPYIVADGDHYDFIIDGYTTSTNYPYSEAYRGSIDNFAGRNYLRNSVKAVVDAYNGSVTLYDFAPDDPIIAAYRRMMPGLIKDRSAMPAVLQRHIRYPEDLFTAQAEVYGTYHMTNPTTFYNREDRWEVPHELYRDTEVEVQPYYVMAQLPRGQAPEFVLMLPLSVAGKNQMAGFLAGRSDGPNYGKLVAYRFPKGRFFDGPAQIESRINSDSRFSANLSLWDQHGSSVTRGSLIILPLIGGKLVAIEPIYIEAEQTKIPTLARVVFGQLLPDDRKIEWGASLAEAEAQLVGAPAPELGGAAPGAAAPSAAGQDQLKQAQAVFHDMQQAYASGDFVRYGQLMQQLKKILAPD